MFLLFGYDRYDATGGIEDLIAIAETLEELEEFINNTEGGRECIKSLSRNFENLYAYNPITESRYDYEDNQFNAIGCKLLRSQKVQTYNEKFD